MLDWTQIAEFDGVDLPGSYILGWRYGADVGGLRFEIDAHLGPQHPSFSTPRPGEWGCFKRAELLFASAAVFGELPDQAEVRPATDANGEEDYSEVHHLALDDGWYHLVTGFADVRIRCEELRFRVLE
jgi:hypothetical protein